MKKKNCLFLLLALVVACFVLCACVQKDDLSKLNGLTIDESSFDNLSEGDIIDVANISVRLTYTDGRYAEVVNECLLFLDDELYSGQPLNAGTHCFVAKYSLEDGKYYVASVTFVVAAVEPNPDPQPHVHDYGIFHVGTAATCTSAGSKDYYECVCGKKFVKNGNEYVETTDLTISALGHEMDDGAITTQPTCTESGTKTFSCKRKDCNYATTQTIDSFGHDFENGTEVDDSRKAATCIAKGEYYVKCSRCEQTEKREIAIDENAHSFGDWQNEVFATCTKIGTKAHKDCLLCKKNFDSNDNEIADLTIAIDKNAHNYGEVHVGTAATCTSAGCKDYYECVCGKKFVKNGNEYVETTDLTISALGHEMDDGAITTQPTCTESGTKTFSCKRKDCNYATTQTIDSFGHDFENGTEVDDSRKAATCIAKGEYYVKCSRCEQTEKREIAIDENAHSFGDWQNEVFATLLSQGAVAHKDCLLCKKHFDGNNNELTDIVLSKITPTFNNVVRDFSLSTYDIKGGDLADAERSLIVHLTNSKVEVQTQPTADGTGTYTVTLPRVDFRVNIAVRTSLSTNNGQGVSLDGENFFAIGGTTLTMLSDGQKIVVTLCSASGTTLQTIEIVDTDIIYGYKGIVFYVKGIRYTSVYLSSMVGMDVSTTEQTSQQLQLNQKSLKDVATYAIVYDYDDTDMDLVANDLADLLGEASGLCYNVFGTYDGSIVKPNSHYIVLGGDLAKQNGLQNFDLTQTNGYNIKQNYTNLYVYSPTRYGTIKGVYGLLAELANFEFFTADTYTFDSSSTLTVASGYTCAVNYDFNYSVAGTAESAYNKLYAYRLGMLADWYAFSGAGEQAKSNVHNYLDILPYATYGETYPQWYEYKSDAKTYVLNLDATDSVMVGVVTDSLKNQVEKLPKQRIFVFGQADTQYGPDVADYLEFVNAVTKNVDEYLQTTNSDRQIIVAMLAYNGTFVPPENGTFYVGTNAKVAVMFAPVGGRHNTPYTESNNKQKNTSAGTFDTETIAKRLNEWASLPGATVLCWLYGTDYYNYMMPFDTLSAMQQNVQLAKSVGDELLFYQLQTYNASTVGSDWQRLKLYVSSKLAKDVNADVDSLIDAFCDAYFGTAASEMKQLLATERTDLYNNRNASGNEDWYGLTNGSALLLNKKCFTLSALKGYMATIDSAKAKVQTAYENGNLTALERDKLIANIDIESLTFRYMLISLHGDTTYDESLDAFKTFAHSLGVVALGENVAN